MIADVSVVIPYYKAEATIVRALQSVASQTMPVKEVIIVNDGMSFERLIELVADFKVTLNIRLVDLGGNFGASIARNLGVAKATSKYIAFLDADDAWHPEKVAIQYAFMYESGAFFSSHGYVFDLNTHQMSSHCHSVVKKLTKWSYVFKNPTYTPTVMLIRSEFSLFDSRLTRSEDLKCWVENLNHGDAYLLSELLAGGYKSPIGASGLSQSVSKMHHGWLDAWRLLLAEKQVSMFMCFVATTFERIKYPIRQLKVKFRSR